MIQATHFDLVETSVIVMTTTVSYSGLRLPGRSNSTYTQEYWIVERERRCTRVHINLAYGANADKNRCRVVIVVCYLGECS